MRSVSCGHEGVHRARRPVVILLGLVALSATVVTAAPPEYGIEILSGSVIHIDDMNLDAEVVGWTTAAGNVRGYVAGPAHPYELLPLPEGYQSSWAKDINDAGVIVGSVGTDFTPEFGEAAMWTPTGDGYEITLLGALPGHTQSVATAINNRGDVIGYSIQPGWQGGPTVWFNHPDGILDLSALGAPSSPQDLNDSGLLCGWNGGLFDLDDLEAMPLPGQVPEDWLPPLSWAINDHGDLAGYVLVASSVRYAIRYTDAMGWETLGNPMGSSAQASSYDINDDRTVVLETSIPGHGWAVGAYFDDGGIVALEDLLAPGEGEWTFLANLGEAINDRGQIAAIAVGLDGQPDGLCILSPLDVVSVADGATVTARLEPAVPSPFRARTTLRYEIVDGTQPVTLDVFGPDGRRVRALVNAEVGPGHHRATWDGRDARGRALAAGVYFVRLEVSGHVTTRPVQLVR